MSDEAPKRTLSRFLPALIGLAAMIAGLGVPGLLTATSQTIDCNGTLIGSPPRQPKAHLGWSVSADGEWLAAGAIHDNATPGSVALYKNPATGSDQIPNQEIAAGEPHPGDQFGTSVSISNSISGYWLAVGAPAGNGRIQDSGVVYIFQLKNGTWSQQAKLEAADAARGAQFGFSVSLSVSLTGATLVVVGAPSDSGGGSLAGAAYVFELPAGVSGPWNQTKLLANDARPFDEFGSAVATDGNEIVVGSPFADDLTVFKNFGAAYVFKRAGNGWTLEDQGKLTEGPFRAGNIQFGAAVAIGGDLIGVGAPGYDNANPNLTDSGSAYVFERNGTTGLYGPAIPLLPEDPVGGAHFGAAVQIAGSDVLIGAPFDGTDPMRAGAGYLFEQNNGAWNQKFKILHTPGGAFGQSVATLRDQVFMGGFQYDGPFGGSVVTDAGAVAVCPIGVQPRSKPSCAKTGPTSVEAGELAGYTVIVSNHGEAPATGVILDDPTPEGLTFVRADKPCDKGFPCSLGTIAAGDSLPPMKVTFQVGEDECSAPNSFTNSATVTGDGAVPFNCKASSTTVLRPSPGPLLSCDKQGPDSAKPGDLITYDITVRNFGCGTAQNVTLSDPTPAGLSLVSVSGPCTQFPCSLGTIGREQTLPPVKATYHVDVPLDCSGSEQTVKNVASVDGAECTAQTRIVPQQADLALVVSDILPTAPETCGSSFSFKLTASNLGPAVAKGAVVEVTVTGAVSLTSNEPGCVPVVSGPQPHLRCSGLPDLAVNGPGHSITFSAQAPVCGPGCAALTLNATVQSGNTCDRNPQNDMLSQMIPVTCTPTADLAITKTHKPANLVPGQPMAYVITVRNNGPSDVTGATVTDSLPNRLLNPHCAAVNPPGCAISGSTLTIQVGPLPAGGEAIYRIEGQLTSQCITTLSNTATVSPPSGLVDPDLSNNTAMDTATIPTTPGVSIQCSGVSGAFEGDFVTFTYVLSNGGPNAQADNPGAELTDTLPAGLALIRATASSGTVTTAANTVSWNGSIPVCGTVTIAVQAKVDPGTNGMTLCNQGTVAFDANGDGVNESNASASCCLRVSLITSTPPIPALGPAGLAALVILLACVALLRLRRRSP